MMFMPTMGNTLDGGNSKMDGIDFTMRSVRRAYIYALIDPRTNEVRYIGKTFHIHGRYAGHCRGKGITHSARWIRELARDGLKPTIEIVEIVNSTKSTDWEAAERQWISNFKLLGYKLTNLTEGGDSGWSLSDDARDRIRQSKLGKKRPVHVGKAVAEANRNRSPEWKAWKAESARNISDETREKMRVAARNPSPEKRAKISATVKKLWADGIFKPMAQTSRDIADAKRRGQKRTPEQRARMSAAAKISKADPKWRLEHSLRLTGRKLSKESILKREATRKAKWLARKAQA